jgi:hypothetical protein
MRHTGHGRLPFCMWLRLPMVADPRISRPEADRSILTNRASGSARYRMGRMSLGVSQRASMNERAPGRHARQSKQTACCFWRAEVGWSAQSCRSGAIRPARRPLFGAGDLRARCEPFPGPGVSSRVAAVAEISVVRVGSGTDYLTLASRPDESLRRARGSSHPRTVCPAQRPPDPVVGVATMPPSGSTPPDAGVDSLCGHDGVHRITAPVGRYTRFCNWWRLPAVTKCHLTTTRSWARRVILTDSRCELPHVGRSPI